MTIGPCQWNRTLIFMIAFFFISISVCSMSIFIRICFPSSLLYLCLSFCFSFYFHLYPYDIMFFLMVTCQMYTLKRLFGSHVPMDACELSVEYLHICTANSSFSYQYTCASWMHTLHHGLSCCPSCKNQPLRVVSCILHIRGYHANVESLWILWNGVAVSIT